MADAPPAERGGRIHTLDSLRGLAALVVVLYHWTLPFARPEWGAVLRHAAFWQTPRLWFDLGLHLLLSGRASIIIFFVLSGFVLALSLHRPGESYGRFVIKRVFRIYPAYVVALGLALLLYWLAGGRPVPQLTEWFNSDWRDPFTPGVIAGHLAMLGTDTYERLLRPSWTLVHEMRISLIFPLLFYAVRKSWRLTLALSFLASFAAALCARFVGAMPADWMMTIFYVVLFVAGAALAEHAGVLQAWLAGKGRVTRVLLWALAILLLLVPDVRLSGFAMYLTGLGAVLAVALCYADERAGRLLNLRAPRYLGRISYSLYLVHQPVLLASLHLFYGRMPLWLVFLAGLAVIFALSDLLNRLVERPFQIWGRVLCGDRRQPQPA